MSRTPATRSEIKFRLAVAFLVAALIAVILVLLFKTPLGQQTDAPNTNFGMSSSATS